MTKATDLPNTMRLAIAFALLCGLMLLLLGQIEALSSNTDISSDEGQKNIIFKRLLAHSTSSPRGLAYIES